MGAMRVALRAVLALVALAALAVIAHLAFIEVGREVVTLRTQRADGTWQSTRLWVVDDDGAAWLHSAGAERAKRFEGDPIVELERGGKISKYRAHAGSRARIRASMRCCARIRIRSCSSARRRSVLLVRSARGSTRRARRDRPAGGRRSRVSSGSTPGRHRAHAARRRNLAEHATLGRGRRRRGLASQRRRTGETFEGDPIVELERGGRIFEVPGTPGRRPASAHRRAAAREVRRR